MSHPAHVVGLAATSGRWSLRLGAMCEEGLEWAMEKTLDPFAPVFSFVLWAPDIMPADASNPWDAAGDRDAGAFQRTLSPGGQHRVVVRRINGTLGLKGRHPRPGHQRT